MAYPSFIMHYIIYLGSFSPNFEIYVLLHLFGIYTPERKIFLFIFKRVSKVFLIYKKKNIVLCLIMPNEFSVKKTYNSFRNYNLSLIFVRYYLRIIICSPENIYIWIRQRRKYILSQSISNFFIFHSWKYFIYKLYWVLSNLSTKMELLFLVFFNLNLYFLVANPKFILCTFWWPRSLY